MMMSMNANAMNANANTGKWNNSIFIPMIDFNITKNQMKDLMEEHLGKVSRIDFVSFNSENGCGRRAFIHFAKWENNVYANSVRFHIETNGFYDMLIPAMNTTPKYNVRLLINKNPVPETEQTIQQVASNMDFMAEKIRTQEEVIQSVTSNMNFMAEKIHTQEEEILGLKQTCENLIFYTSQLQLRVNQLVNDLSNKPSVVVIEDDIMGEMQLSELI